MLLRSQCKNLKPYDNRFWDFSNDGEVKFCNENSGLPKFAPLVARTSLGPIPNIVAYLSLLLWSHALRSDQLLSEVKVLQCKRNTIAYVIVISSSSDNP